jgi:hypothetical protein
MIKECIRQFAARNQRMKKEIYSSVSPRPRPPVNPAPSLRVPVTTRNRAFLRWLRAAELAAWEAGQACSEKLISRKRNVR